MPAPDWLRGPWSHGTCGYICSAGRKKTLTGMVTRPTNRDCWEFQRGSVAESSGLDRTGSGIMTVRAWDLWFPLMFVDLFFHLYGPISNPCDNPMTSFNYGCVGTPEVRANSCANTPKSRSQTKTNTLAGFQDPVCRDCPDAFEVPPRFLLFTRSCCRSPQGALFPIILAQRDAAGVED